ncbi:MAG: polynucleotide adenylyltransferase PcnB [Thermoanaerobaculia bacterium]|nr:polynucleotide adenylyltransferase PcnB [Thermoanaerobaculia bacterium]
MSDPQTDDGPIVLARPDHPISRSNISSEALKVLYRLRQKGFKAYLVGGSVRDLMLGRTPKDFDIGTDARPQEVRRLFRNSRLIGRRFRIVHVVFGGEVLEVSTFRRSPDPRRQDSEEGELLVTSDNTYGTPRQDAFRRDFTINGLFYDIEDFSVIDYVGGIADLRRKVVRVIGDPDVRMQEDPVRMMRACEFAGRLGFGIENATQEGIQRNRERVEQASPARVTEEIIQLLRCGSSGGSIQWMLELGLLEVLLPEASAMLERNAGGVADFGRLLPTIDSFVAEGRIPSEATVLAILVLPKIMFRRDKIESESGRPMSRAAIRSLVEDCVDPFSHRFALSRNRRAQMLQALVGFHRLCEPTWTPSARTQFARRAYFDDALQLFEILVRATGGGQEALDTWSQAARRRGSVEAAVDESAGAGNRRRRRRSGRRRR